MRTIAIAAAVVAALSACSEPKPSPKPTATIAQPAAPPAGAVSKAHLIAGADMGPSAPTMAVETLELKSFTTGAWPVTLYDYYNLGGDCSERRVSQRIVEAPKHGTLSLVITTVGNRNGFDPSDPRARCEASGAPLYQAVYTPASGFRGADHLVLEINDDGHLDRYGLTVDVR